MSPKVARTVRRQLATLQYPYDASEVKALAEGHRKRIGNYRALFKIDNEKGEVLVTDIPIRGDAY